MSNAFRWTALFLLFLNISYFGWFMLSSDARKTKSAPAKMVQGGQSLRLLNELGSEERKHLGKDNLSEQGEQIQAALSALPGETPFSKSYCPSLGPMENRQFAEDVRRSLVNVGLRVDLRVAELDSAEKYRVYLPSYTSYEEASLELRKLRANKIDSYIMSEDGFVHAISLGIFSQIDSAEGLAKKLLAHGYQVKVSPISYKKEVFWLDIQSPLDIEKTEQIMIRVMDLLDEITRIDAPCKSVALTQ